MTLQATISCLYSNIGIVSILGLCLGAIYSWLPKGLK